MFHTITDQPHQWISDHHHATLIQSAVILLHHGYHAREEPVNVGGATAFTDPDCQRIALCIQRELHAIPRQVPANPRPRMATSASPSLLRHTPSRSRRSRSPIALQRRHRPASRIGQRIRRVSDHQSRDFGRGVGIGGSGSRIGFRKWRKSHSTFHWAHWQSWGD